MPVQPVSNILGRFCLHDSVAGRAAPWEELATEKYDTRVTQHVSSAGVVCESGNYSGGGQINVEHTTVLPLEIRSGKW